MLKSDNIENPIGVNMLCNYDNYNDFMCTTDYASIWTNGKYNVESEQFMYYNFPNYNHVYNYLGDVDREHYDYNHFRYDDSQSKLLKNVNNDNNNFEHFEGKEKDIYIIKSNKCNGCDDDFIYYYLFLFLCFVFIIFITINVTRRRIIVNVNKEF